MTVPAHTNTTTTAAGLLADPTTRTEWGVRWNDVRKDGRVAYLACDDRAEAEVKAEAWDEGERAGLCRADFEYGHATIQAVKTNPYREEARRG